MRTMSLWLTSVCLVAVVVACGNDVSDEGARGTSTDEPSETEASVQVGAASPDHSAAPSGDDSPDGSDASGTAQPTSSAAGAEVTTTARTTTTVPAVTTTTAPAPAPAETTTTAPAPAETATTVPEFAVPPRVLLVGDSTLLAVRDYGALDALLGMDAVYEAASCRALAQPSCSKNPPRNSVRVIDALVGTVDVVVIMAGYDEWYTTFADSFDKVVASSRAKGATRIIWLTYPEGVDYRLPNERRANDSLINMNAIMFEKVASGAFPDVVVADWFRYAAVTQGWYTRDDIHLSQTGAFGVADYISRKVAFVIGQPCPMPREPGQPVETPCPDPDTVGPVPDVVALYAA